MEQNKNIGELFIGTKNVHHTVIPIYKYVHSDGSSKQVAQIKYNDYKPSDFDVTEKEADELAELFASAPKLKEQLSVLKEENESLNKTITDLLETGSSKLSQKQIKELEQSNVLLKEVLEIITTSPEWIKNYGGGEVDRKAHAALNNLK